MCAGKSTLCRSDPLVMLPTSVPSTTPAGRCTEYIEHLISPRAGKGGRKAPRKQNCRECARLFSRHFTTKYRYGVVGLSPRRNHIQIYQTNAYTDTHNRTRQADKRRAYHAGSQPGRQTGPPTIHSLQNEIIPGGILLQLHPGMKAGKGTKRCVCCFGNEKAATWKTNRRRPKGAQIGHQSGNSTKKQKEKKTVGWLAS